MMIMKMLMMVAKSKTVKMMMVTGVWEDNDPSLSVRCKAEGRPRALPRIEVAQVGNILMMVIMIMIMMMFIIMIMMILYNMTDKSPYGNDGKFNYFLSPGSFRQLW